MKYAMTEQELEVILKDMPKRGVQVMRFKGLGEMDADELAETAMDPTTRRLVRIELEDAVEANEIFTMLMGDTVGPRRDFITTHAKQVSYLDV
jgi:DNA gyrase subunit B